MIHSFLLIGQSNMAGRGFAEEAVPVDFSRIKMLRNGRWQPVFRPINPDRKTAGVNLAESFAEAYSRKYDTEVGIIPAADGGTKWHIDLWEANRMLLTGCGIEATEIEVAGICTYSRHGEFFSARRLGIESGRIFSGIIVAN